MFEKNFFKRFSVFCFFIFFSVSVFAQCLQGEISLNELPQEAQKTLSLIKRNGPFPYKKDGSFFLNYEGCLPKQKRGYYREFTVKTPKAKNRGARRIISGDIRKGEFYYTSNHYRTFKRVKTEAGIERSFASENDLINVNAKKRGIKDADKNVSKEKKIDSGAIFATLIIVLLLLIYLIRRYGNARR